MADVRSRQAGALVRAIEAEMRAIGLWESVAPPPEDVASPLPFCYDTLAFHQWLQWVFIPRMRTVLDHGMRLPRESAIAALAEEELPRLPQDTRRLSALLEDFDRCIAEQREGAP